MKTLLLTGSIAVVLSTACAVGGPVASSSQSLLDSCSGHYACVSGTDVSDVVLHKEGDVCMENSNVVFNADGTVSVDGKVTGYETWSGDSSLFHDCFDSVDQNGVAQHSCQTCTPKSPTPEAGTTGGKCTGTTYGCEEQSPPSCSDVRGCYMGTRIGPNNSFENYCSGYPDSCDEMDTPSDCTKQGCTWKP
jgi:hypothetical protein